MLPEDANDVDGDLENRLMRAKILEEGYTGEYWHVAHAVITALQPGALAWPKDSDVEDAFLAGQFYGGPSHFLTCCVLQRSSVAGRHGPRHPIGMTCTPSGRRPPAPIEVITPRQAGSLCRSVSTSWRT